MVFPPLLKKFPETKLLSCGQVVSGIGGFTKPLSGKVGMSIKVAQQTVSDYFMFNDYPIDNLDALIGTGILKKFHSWSVGGMILKGAFMEINEMNLKLLGFGERDGNDIAVTLWNQTIRHIPGIMAQPFKDHRQGRGRLFTDIRRHFDN